MERRYHAVVEVISGAPVTEVARRHGVSRQAVHLWLGEVQEGGLAGLADHSRRPHFQPRQLEAGIEAKIRQLRNDHSRWGATTAAVRAGQGRCGTSAFPVDHLPCAGPPRPGPGEEAQAPPPGL